jgi:hypothetical protein
LHTGISIHKFYSNTTAITITGYETQRRETDLSFAALKIRKFPILIQYMEILKSFEDLLWKV